MSLAPFKYSVLLNKMISYCKANCKNIDGNYNSLNSSLRPGWSKSEVIAGAGTRLPRGITYRIVTSVPQYTSADIDADYNKFLTINKIDPEIICTENNIIKILLDIASFLSTKLCFYSGQFYTTQNLCYDKLNNNFVNMLSLNIEAPTRLIYAEDGDQIITSLIDTIIQNFDQKVCTYSTSLY